MSKQQEQDLQDKGMSLYHDRGNSRKAKTPRAKQKPAQLKGTWQNDNGPGMETRIETCVLWHAKKKDPETISKTQAVSIIKGFDTARTEERALETVE